MIFSQYVKNRTGLGVMKEYHFHDKRKWRFDYAIPEIMLAIEVEGGVWRQGRHTRGTGFIKDMEKYNTAALMGWCMIRVTPDSLLTLKTIEMIQLRIKNIELRKYHEENI